jgi:glycosyltransferase involved in cell wall biosynthesis
MPGVSVVIPAYNAERYLAATLESVLAQTYQDFEVIVVDDGSTDGTAELARGFGPPVRVVQQPNSGPSAARNRGVREARSDLVAFIDADDLWMPEKLELQVPRFDEEGRVGLVYTRTQLIDEDGNLLPTPQHEKPRGRVFYDLLEGNVLGTSTAVVRKACLEAAGLFPEDMVWCEDWCLWLRIAREREFDFVDRILVKHRRHAASLTAERERTYRGALEAVRRVLADADDPRARKIGGRTVGRLHRRFGMGMLAEEEWAAARRPLLRALRRRPLDFGVAGALAVSFLPAPLRRRVLAHRRRRNRSPNGIREELNP